jgi:hypothetical protein
MSSSAGKNQQNKECPLKVEMRVGGVASKRAAHQDGNTSDVPAMLPMGYANANLPTQKVLQNVAHAAVERHTHARTLVLKGGVTFTSGERRV